MAYSEKRGDKVTGRWYGRVRIGNKKFQQAFETKREAEGYELYVKLQGEEPPTITKRNAGRTFAAVAKECKDAGGPKGVWKRGFDHSTLQRLEWAVAKLGAIDIGDVTRKVVRERLVADLEKRKLAPATINRYVAVVSAVLTFAVNEEIIDVKPKLPFAKETGARQDILPWNAEEPILELMNSQGHKREALIVLFLLESGMRVSELYGRIVDPERYRLKPEQIGDGIIRLRGDQTKNHDTREVIVDADLCRAVRALVAANKLPDRYHLLRVFKKAAQECGHPETLVIHSLRHTRNTRLRKQGVDMKTRMQMLGHKTTSASMRYDHIDIEDQLEAVKKVDAKRGQSPETAVVVPFEPNRKVS